MTPWYIQLMDLRSSHVSKSLMLPTPLQLPGALCRNQPRHRTPQPQRTPQASVPWNGEGDVNLYSSPLFRYPFPARPGNLDLLGVYENHIGFPLRWRLLFNPSFWGGYVRGDGLNSHYITKVAIVDIFERMDGREDDFWELRWGSI